MKTVLRMVERGYIPKPFLRRGIRRLLDDRLREQRSIFEPDRDQALERWVEQMRSSEVAPVPEKANEQHYEVPAAFFESVLGPRLKYSSGYYPDDSSTLGEAEEAMLALTAQRAMLVNGQDVLELGCGWGSLTLWMAENYPASRIVAISNSASQRHHIMTQAAQRGLGNIEVVTCDMNEFRAERRFDRVVSVEMFEHMRNWEELLTRVSQWMAPGGRLFLHVFAHQRYAYPFEVQDDSDWMSEHFFSGGMMPCPDLVDRLDMPLEVEERWVVSGTHYGRTSEDWLRNIEEHREEVLEIFAKTYGESEAIRWYHRWRVFFLSCAELFNFDDGKEWFVSHMRLRATPQEAM
ncbi:MAG: cyclopropane-fatty-acyl-phospholipid synthase [Candidatus Paceibacteria bacterium]|jgi:cyclopropane-fatty-acyl-phospholipid synthase